MGRLVQWCLAVVMVAAIATTAAAQDRPRVVAVNYPLQYFAEQLVGDAAEVVFPVPADADPSFWRPSVADITMIQSADLILLNGAGFAAWIDRVSLPRSKLVNTTAAVEDQFIVTESITHSHGDGGEHSHEGLASYTWLDLNLAKAQVDAIAAAIVRKGLVAEDTVQERLRAVHEELDALDTATGDQLAGLADVPMITTHPRYQYFARRYDLTVLSVAWEAGAMPSDAELAELTALQQETDARVLIWEAEPPEAGIAAAGDIGLSSAVFAPLAHQSDGRSFSEAYAAAVAGIVAAAKP